MNRPGAGFVMAVVLVTGAGLKSDAAQADDGDGRWGTFRGRVTFNGQAPAPVVVADPEWRSAPRDHRGNLIPGAAPRRLPDFEVIAGRGAPVRSERLLVDPETKGVRNALVHLVKPGAVRDEARQASPRALTFRADRGVFTPHVLAAMDGAEVQVSTQDPAVYDLHGSLPKAEFLVEEDDTRLAAPRLEPRLGLNSLFGSFRDGRSLSLRVWPRAVNTRPLPISDDIHVWMSAWWFVFDHPYFAVTDGRGAFEIRDVPAGPQQVVVWQESVGPSGKVFEGEVVILGTGATARDFAIEPGQVRAAAR